MPVYGADKLHEADDSFFKELINKLNKYMEQLEAVKLKDGLRTAMDFSSDCNLYF